MQNKRSITGRARIIFENKNRLMYNYCTYRKSETRMALYNVVFSTKNVQDLLNNLPYTNIRDKVIPNYKIIDEKGAILLDSKFDRLENFMDR